MKLTIAICTWNRAPMLRSSLAALRLAVSNAATPPEIIVVNNNSTDETDRVIEEAARELPIRRLFEPAPGLSHARNHAVRNASGEYIIWTDDDALVNPGWLRSYENAIAQWPDAAFLGGPVQPVLEGDPPRWLTAAWSEVKRVYAAIDISAEPIEIRPGATLPYGANFACRVDLQRIFPYDPNLGHQPSDYWRAGEEHAMLTRLLETGHSGRWVPDAGVRHIITPDRQTFRTFIAHGFGNGRTQARINRRAPDDRILLGRPLSLWISFARACGQTVSTGLLNPPYSWVPKAYEASVLAGRLRDFPIV